MARTVDWQAAECLGADTEIFYPKWKGEGDDGTIGAPIELYDDPKAVCAACSQQSECLSYAMVNKERYGCWGGLAPIERLRIERKRRRKRLEERRAREASDERT